MVKKYQLLSITLLVMIILCSINFAAGQFGIGFARVPNRPLGGGCREKCEADEMELNENTNCGGLKYCYYANYSFWDDLEKSFANNDGAGNKKECLVRGIVSGGSTERKTGTTCRQTCNEGEEEIKTSSAVCSSGLICCSDPDNSSFKSWFLNLWNKNKNLGV